MFGLSLEAEVAHVEKRGPGRWRARYRDPSGRELSRTFERKADAERFLALTEADKAQGAWIDPAAGRTSFGAYARQWQQAQVHRGTTADQVDSNLRNHILPTFEHRSLAAVRPSEIQIWVKHRTEILAPATVEVVYRYLAAIFGAAVKDRLILRSPCVGVKLPRPDPAEVVPATTAEVLAIAAAMPTQYRALVLLAAGTGVRQGEAFGVVLPNLDLVRGLLRVDRQLVLRARHAPEVAPPKTDASVRTIPLSDGVVQVLVDHITEFPAVDRAPYGSLIFTTPIGEPIRRNRFGEVWRRALRHSDVRQDLTFHDLRHYYASLLIRHGESVKVIQRRLGHKTAKETLDTYGHLWPDSDEKTRSAVDAELFRDLRTDAGLDRGMPSVTEAARQWPELPRPGRGLAGGSNRDTAGHRGCKW